MRRTRAITSLVVEMIQKLVRTVAGPEHNLGFIVQRDLGVHVRGRASDW